MLLVLNSSTMPGKTRANRVPSTPSMSPSRVQLFRNERSHEAYEKLNSKRKIWAERSVILGEVDLAIRANIESRGWLSLLEIDHPPPTALIREFFSNLSYHIYDSNTVVRSWIRGVEFTITPRVVAKALGVPVVTDPVYPYDESPPIDEVMSHITGSSIQWGSNPRITFSALSESMSFLVAHFSSPHHPSGAMCVSLCFHVWCVYHFSSLVPSFFE